MNQTLSPKDSRRVAIFERFVRNANHLLKKKSAQEIEKIIDDQDGFINWIKDSSTRERLLAVSKELRDTALNSLSNFDEVMHRLKNCEQLVKWKTSQEITTFFDEVDRDIANIPDQRMKLNLKQNSLYWRARRLDEYYINSSRTTLDKVSADKALAWKTLEEVESFFTSLQRDISKIGNKEIRWALYDFSEFHKADAIQMIELKQQQDSFPDWLNEKKPD